MTSTEYTSIARKFKSRDVEIGPKALTILGYFASTDKLSTYQVYSEFRNSCKTAYKNIHKTVQRLFKLGLVSTTKVKDAQHGAKYYEISEQGLFYIFQRTDKLPLWVRSNLYKSLILKEHSNLLQNFLYTYLSRETFSSLESFGLTERKINAREIFLEQVFTYLQNCCKSVNDWIKTLENPKWPLLVNEDQPERMNLLNMIDRLISLFRYGDESTGEFQEILEILSKDNKFARILDIVYNDLKKDYENYMNLRNKIL